jgi:signal transduction histidine kinase
MLRALIGFLSLAAIAALIAGLGPAPSPLWAEEPSVSGDPPGSLAIHSSTDPIDQYLVADCDGDGWDEVLTYGVEQPGFTDVLIRWYYDGSRFRQAQQWPVRQGKITDCVVTDLEQDGTPDILAARLGGMQSWVEVYEAGNPEPVRSSPRIDLVDRDGDGAWGGNFFIKACCDIDGDGVKDIFVSHGAGYDLLPRGLTVLSGRDFAELGSFATAGPPERVEIFRADDPADMVILLSTESVSNGHSVGEFNDVAMYLMALAPDLEVLWHVEATPSSARWDYEIVDPAGGERAKVVMSRRWQRGSDANTHRLEMRDIYTGEETSFRPLVTDVDAMLVADLNRDTAPEIVIALVDGTVQVLDGALEPVYERSEEPVLFLFFADDIDQDGNMEILGRGTSTRIRVFDERLNILASRDLGSLVRRMEFALVGPREPFLLASVSANRDLRFLKLKGARRPIGEAGSMERARPSSPGRKTTGLLIAIAFVAGLGIALVTFRKKPGRASKEEAFRAQLVAALAAFGHSGAGRSNLERLAQYCEVPPEPEDPKYAEYQRRLTHILEGYREFTRLKLEQIAEICRRFDECRQHAATLGRNLKKLNNLAGTTERASRTTYDREELKEISSSARVLLEEVLGVTQKVMAAYSIDVGAAVCRIMPVIKERLEGFEGFGVSRVGISIEDGGLARMGDDALKTCLEILLENGAEALKESPEKVLQVTVSGEGDSVEVRVSDTGSGIDKADWNKVFERGFTTRGEGRGEGLYLAREAAQRFGARIFVASSEPGEGTVVVIRLKRVSE